MINVKAPEDIDNRRIDSFIAEKLPELSRSAIKKLCDSGKVTINSKVVKASHKLKSNDKIAIDFNPDAVKATPKIKLPILYEDDDCLVIDKPAGVLTHSKGAFNPEATVATFIKPRLSKDGPWKQEKDGVTNERAGIVHRLDRATSGVIICAKNPAAHAWLQKQFSTRKVKKTYLAVVQGDLPEKHAIIDMPIERNPKKPQTFRVGVNGKPAMTEYKILKSNSSYSMVELTPKTGRTHQLRVHLAKLKHPILGDQLYGGQPAERLFLHAVELELTLPSGQRKKFSSPLPDIFRTKIEV